MFYKYKKNNTFEDIVQDIRLVSDQDLYLPVEIDTEYQQKHFPFIEYKDQQELTISVQMKPIGGRPLFYLHKDMKSQKIKHKTNVKFIESDFCVIDMLQDMGINISIIENEPSTYNILYIDLIGYFVISDLVRLFDNEWCDEILSKMSCNSKAIGVIEHKKRLKCVIKLSKDIELPYIYLNKYIDIEGKIYKIAIGVIDNFGLQGAISYKDLCLNTSINMTTKNIISTIDKKEMLKVYKESPDQFIEYAQGDLMNYEALQGHSKLFKELYDILDLGDYYKTPKPTIGASVHCLLESALRKHFEIESLIEFYKTVNLCSHNILALDNNSTQIYLAKTNGGRCYNNRPTEPSLSGVIVDIDIKGCYGRGIQMQEYPIGRPIIIDYKIDSTINHYNTLKEFLDIYEEEIVDGLWFCRITTTEELTFNQDFFASWYPPENIKNILITDSLKEEEDNTSILENDYNRIYSRELHLSPLQSDGLEWIRHSLTKQEREEFLSKCIVVAAAFYPKSTRCKTLEEYKTKREKHVGKNQCKVRLKNRKVILKTYEENYYWYSANLGEIIITKLLKKRELYSKKISGEAQMNKFIKLIINTIYGDIVSPYFYIGNTVVGNNITARARAMAWYMEKSLHATQTITDGCCFDINKVVKSRYALTNTKYWKIKTKGSQKDLSYGFLLGKKQSYENIKIIDQKKLAQTTQEHIIKTFPKPKVTKQYELEIKTIITGLSTHGASNYQTRINNKIVQTKMRSYKNESYPTYNQDNSKKYNRIESWLDSLYKNPKKVRREEPFVEEKIVKTKEYKKQVESNTIKILPGNLDYTVRLITECVLSMFLFRTHKQYKSWEQEYRGLRKLYQQSYEARYTDEEGNLDYQKMIEEIQNKISKGEKRYKNKRDFFYDHPKKITYENYIDHIKQEVLK